MSQNPEPPIQVRVDPTNPGQFFACCGLLELADRLWHGAEGWFGPQAVHFCIRPTEVIPSLSANTLVDEITQCHLTNTMTESQLQRRDELAAMTKSVREADSSLRAEKNMLDALWREAAIIVHEPFNVCLDWFLDERAGGKTFKSWAGQQSVVDIAGGIKALIEVDPASPEKCLSQLGRSDCVPFYFDSDLGGAGSDLDVGFSFDPLKSIGLRVTVRPLLEFAAFVGLQRFRPGTVGTKNEYEFSAWSEPLLPEAAAPVVCGHVESLKSGTFSFGLLYRTKYLKSFLPATRITRSRQ